MTVDSIIEPTSRSLLKWWNVEWQISYAEIKGREPLFNLVCRAPLRSPTSPLTLHLTTTTTQQNRVTRNSQVAAESGDNTEAFEKQRWFNLNNEKTVRNPNSERNIHQKRHPHPTIRRQWTQLWEMSSHFSLSLDMCTCMCMCMCVYIFLFAFPVVVQNL